MIVCDTSEKPLMVLHLLHHRKVRSALCFTKSVESAHRLYKLIQLYERQRTSPTPATKDNTTAAKIEEIVEKGTKKEESEESSSDSDSGSDSNSSDSDSDNSSEDEDGEEKDDV